jgi:hypothetical protein
MDQQSPIVLDQHRGETVPSENRPYRTTSVWATILTDVHFWVPAIVLLAGLAVLHWIR